MAYLNLSKKLAHAIGPIALAVLALSGCGAPDGQAPQSAAPPAAPAAAVATPAPAPAQAGDRLYIRDGLKGDAERLAVIDSASGAHVSDLPPGLASPDWSTLYNVEVSGGKTRVRAFDLLDLRAGQALRETTLDGAYSLPRIRPDGAIGGLSPDGRWLALQQVHADGTLGSQFVVLDAGFTKPPKPVDLNGDFWFDGLSSGAKGLYLTEYLTADRSTKYQVRYYDLASGTLDPNPVVVKGEGTEMAGVHQTSVASPDGQWLYGLYLNTESGPFIHALNLDGRFALCIDLPKDGMADKAKQAFWALAIRPDGTLYAANGALGLVAEVRTSADSTPQIQRTLKLPPDTAAAPAPTSQVEPALVSATALSPDGKTLFMPGERGLLAIDTRDLKLRAISLTDWRLDSVAVSPDGARLYVASAAQGKIMQIDPAAGTITAEVPAAGSPRGVLRVEAR
jgi:YVTN family beta-propeller protein